MSKPDDQNQSTELTPEEDARAQQEDANLADVLKTASIIHNDHINTDPEAATGPATDENASSSVDNSHDHANLTEALKSAQMHDEQARIVRADEEFGDDDPIPFEDQISFLWYTTPEMVEALNKRHPYLQVMQVYEEGTQPPEFKADDFVAESGWNVSDYGSAFATSRGEYSFSEGDFRVKIDNDNNVQHEGEVFNEGKGTYINQAVKTAEELARLAVVRGWDAAEIYGADPLMAWAFWAEASYYGLAVFGYEPSAEDIARRNRVKMSRKDLEEAIKAKRDLAKMIL